jgi:FtsZ-binding cell division protein ZapB
MEIKFIIFVLMISLTVALKKDKPPKKKKPGGTCSLTFKVDSDKIQGLCQSPQAPQGIVMQEMQTMKAENAKLRNDLDAMKAEYESMVDTVKTLKAETATWREIIEWPLMDAVFKPDNETLYIDPDGPTYKGKGCIAYSKILFSHVMSPKMIINHCFRHMITFRPIIIVI